MNLNTPPTIHIWVSEMYGNDDEEGIPATFQIIYFIGWKPDPSQVCHPFY